MISKLKKSFYWSGTWNERKLKVTGDKGDGVRGKSKWKVKERESKKGTPTNFWRFVFCTNQALLLLSSSSSTSPNFTLHPSCATLLVESGGVIRVGNWQAKVEGNDAFHQVSKTKFPLPLHPRLKNLRGLEILRSFLSLSLQYLSLLCVFAYQYILDWFRGGNAPSIFHLSHCDATPNLFTLSPRETLQRALFTNLLGFTNSNHSFFKDFILFLVSHPSHLATSPCKIELLFVYLFFKKRESYLNFSISSLFFFIFMIYKLSFASEYLL